MIGRTRGLDVEFHNVPQLNVVVELFIIGIFAHVPILIAIRAFKSDLFQTLGEALKGDQVGLMLFVLACWCYLFGILVNAGVYRVLQSPIWPIRSWYGRFRQREFNDRYFRSLGQPIEQIPDDSLVEKTIIYVGLKNGGFVPRYEFFLSVMRLVRAASMILGFTGLILFVLIFVFREHCALMILLTLGGWVGAYFCWRTFVGIEINQYLRLLRAFHILKRADDPHLVTP